jgi:hypothetical protein
MSNRRRNERRPCAELVNISTATRRDRAGLARDLSAAGVRFQSASKFAIGERVNLLFQNVSIGTVTANGRVIWTSPTPDYTSPFPHAAAVEFDAVCPELDAPPPTDSARILAVAELI